MADKQAVVLVENPDEADFIARLLTYHGDPAVPVVEAAAVIDAIEAGTAGSLVIGATLGRDSGLAVVERVRNLDADAGRVPIVVIAEASRPIDRLRAWERGADAFLTKPFHFDELVEALATAAASDPDDRERRRREQFESERKQVAERRRR